MLGVKTGGRQKGTPNKRSLEIQAVLEQHGCDPIKGMAAIAMNRKNPPELRGRMFAELAQYIHPKRKAIEHSGPEGGPINVELVQRLNSAKSRMQELVASKTKSEPIP